MRNYNQSRKVIFCDVVGQGWSVFVCLLGMVLIARLWCKDPLPPQFLLDPHLSVFLCHSMLLISIILNDGVIIYFIITVFPKLSIYIWHLCCGHFLILKTN